MRRSAVSRSGSPISLGPPDGIPDIIEPNLGVVGLGEPEVAILPGRSDEEGNLTGYGLPQQLFPTKLPPLYLDVVDLNQDGALDIAVVDAEELLINYGEQPNIPPINTLATARDLGTIVHYVDQTRTIVPGHEDAFFWLRVPVETVLGSGDEVIDFSGLFEATSGVGLSMEVLDTDGNVLASGERFSVGVAQEENYCCTSSAPRVGRDITGRFRVRPNICQIHPIDRRSRSLGDSASPGPRTRPTHPSSF
jgi:hypothetical protein